MLTSVCKKTLLVSREETIVDMSPVEMRISQIERRNEDLQQRLRRSERRVRLITGGCVLSLAIACFAGAMAADDDFFTVQQPYLILKDPNNSRMRIDIGTNAATSSSGIGIYDKDGHKRVALGLANNGVPCLIFYSVNGDEVKVISP